MKARKKEKLHFSTLMDMCHLKNAELELKHPKLQKDESCSSVTQQKWRTLQSSSNSNVRVPTYMDTVSQDISGPNHGQTLKILLDPPTCCPRVGETNWKNFISTGIGKGSELGMFVCSSEVKIVLFSIRGWHQHGWKKGEYSPTLMKSNQYKELFKSRIPATVSENYQSGRNLTQISSLGPTTWMDMDKKRWQILWIGKNKNGVICQSFKSLLGWSQLREGRVGTVAKVFFQNFMKCL